MKSYNGVAVLTRVAPDAVFFGFDDQLPDIDDVRLMRVVVNGIPIINTYVPNGYKIGTPQHDYKLRWFARLKNYFAQHLSADRPALWCGDMNVAPAAIDVHSPEKHLRHVCFHESVRAAYRDTVSWGFIDVFRHRYPDKQLFTFWDYLRPSSLDQNKGWRLDHILATRSWQKNAPKSTWMLNRAERCAPPTIRFYGLNSMTASRIAEILKSRIDVAFSLS